MATNILERRNRIQERLVNHGIVGYEITHLDYLKFDENEFFSPIEVGTRMMILYAVAHIASEPKVDPN